MMISIFLIILLCVAIYYKLIKPLSYWKKRGVVHKKPWPILGNMSNVVFYQKSMFNMVEEMYQEFPNERYFGIHQFVNPILVVKDLELIKRITVKDYEQFIDHNNTITEELDPLMGKNLVQLKGQKWRDMRTTLSPSFTSSKMKIMFSLVSECAEQFAKYFEAQKCNLSEMEMKDVFTRFTNDAIASVAFGLKCNSLEEKTNDFYMMGKRATNFSGSTLFALNMYMLFPKLAKFLQLKIIPNSVASFFSAIIRKNVESRTKKGVIRPDMIRLLLEARKTADNNKVSASDEKSSLTITDEDITAQALIFFFGGFETSATLMCFIAYELAVNENIQRRLQEEIDSTLIKCDGTLTYEAVHKMKYMEMVISETLRKWPPGFILDRMCVKDYKIEPIHPWEKELVIKKGEVIQIPMVGIHRDPKYFPNPEEFDPERFNDGNKQKIEPFSYLPFGSGPRICIASRFALMENKILMFHLLSKFDIVKTEKTSYPIQLAKNSFNLIPKEGFWLGLRLRKME